MSHLTNMGQFAITERKISQCCNFKMNILLYFLHKLCIRSWKETLESFNPCESFPAYRSVEAAGQRGVCVLPGVLSCVAKLIQRRKQAQVYIADMISFQLHAFTTQTDTQKHMQTGLQSILLSQW